MRRVLLPLMLWFASLSTAHAQVTGPPFTFIDGTRAVAAEVNTNFTTIYNAALNRTAGTMTGTLTSQQITPATTNTYDLGTASVFFRTGYLRTSLVLGQTTANYTLTWANPASARAISIADPGGTDVFTFNAATQTLTNKTLTAPVLSGSVTGTYTLAGTPTITNPTINAATLTGTLAGTPTFSGVFTNSAFGSHTFVAGGTGTNAVTLQNTTAGTGNFASLLVSNDGNKSLRMDMFSSTFTTSADAMQSGSRITAGGTGGLSITALDAAGVIRFYSGGTNLRWGVNAAGDWIFGASSHINNSSGTPGLGTASTSSIAGIDSAFIISASGIFTVPTITFGHTWSTSPACTVSSSADADVLIASLSTTTLTLSRPALATFTNPSVVYVHCESY